MRVGGSVAAVLMAMAVPAESAVITQQVDFGRFVQASFSQLAPDAGPLLQVRLDWTTSATAEATVFLPAGPPPTPRALALDYGVSSNFTFFFPDVSDLQWSDTTGFRHEEFAGPPASVLLATAGDSHAIVGSGDLGRFIGTDIVRVGGGGSILLAGVNFGGWPIDVSTTAPANSGRGTITITYVTGEVPEPAAWTLMIAGFGLVGAAMRRRTPLRAA